MDSVHTLILTDLPPPPQPRIASYASAKLQITGKLFSSEYIWPTPHENQTESDKVSRRYLQKCIRFISVWGRPFSSRPTQNHTCCHEGISVDTFTILICYIFVLSRHLWSRIFFFGIVIVTCFVIVRWTHMVQMSNIITMAGMQFNRFKMLSHQLAPS